MDIKDTIVKSGRMTEEQYGAAIKQKLKEGARSENSAKNKIYRDVAVETVEADASIGGYWLQEYEKKNKNVSGYMQLEDGTTLKIAVVEGTPQPKSTLGRDLVYADPVVLSNCVKKRNIFTGSMFYETTKTTTVKEANIATPLVDCCSEYNEKMKDGIYTLRGVINRVWGVRPFGVKDAQMLPIVGRGGVVNLRVVVDSGGQKVNVSIPDESKLKKLIGNDLDWLYENDAIKELSDMLRGIPIVVFGRLGTVIFKGKPEEKKTNPYINMRNFGFILPVQERGTKAVDAKTSVGEDEVEEEDEA